jgi:hypothetical protein
MSLNGSGVFSVNSAGQPVVSGTLITATAFNAVMQDIAAALSTALYKDGQQLNAANQAMGGFKLTGLGAGTTDGDSVRYEQLTALTTDAATKASIQTQGYSYFTAAGSVNAMTGTLSPAIAAYVAGLRVSCIPNLANTTATPTLNLNALGAKTIKKRDAGGTKAAVEAGDYNPSGPFDFVYDGTDFILLAPLNSASVPAGTIINFAAESPPAGYLVCPTSATYVSATTYRTLAYAIGTIWGTSGATVAAGAFTPGNTYVIKTVGSTDYTLIGASANTIGVVFTATGAGAGTGNANSEITLPYFNPGYSAVQTFGSNVGDSTYGTNLEHSHTMAMFNTVSGASSSPAAGAGGAAGTMTTANQGNANGNLAAGSYVLMCVKY